MICAVYARKSTEQSGLADESKSVTRQTEHARAYASRKGWAVADAHVYVDDGISGALFGASRPGLARLLASLTPRPPFRVLIMSEESRLGREAIETAWALKRITDAGVQVFFYLDDRERTLDSPTDKMMLSLTAFAAEMERDRARVRTHDALLRKAKSGHVTGGVVFGYVNRAVTDGARRSYVERFVDPREAAVVRQIFTRAAEGWGVKRIAASLNDEGAPAPMPRRQGRPRGWAPSSIREVLHRDLYHGVVVWNRTARIVRQGARAQRERPAGDVVSVTRPELAIVDETLWKAAQERMQASAEIYRQRTGGQAFGRPANGVESPYILTGLGTCAACGGSMAVLKRAHGPRGNRRQVPFYGCMTRHLRGDAICKNRLEVRLADAEEAVLTAVEHDVLRVEILETSLYKAVATLQAPTDFEDQSGAVREELVRIDAEVTRLAQAVAAGGEIPALIAAMQERERRRSYLRTELATVQRQASVPHGAADLEPALAVMREALTDWQGMLRQETGPARRAMQALLKGRLVFTPQEHDSERFYTFEGEGSISPIISGIAGLQRVWWPQRDSNPCLSHAALFASIVGDLGRVEYMRKWTILKRAEPTHANSSYGRPRLGRCREHGRHQSSGVRSWRGTGADRQET
jgi:site-specific DNA recombinase